MNDKVYSRRGFIHLCGTAAALAAQSGSGVQAQPLTDFARVQLVDRAGAPLAVDTLEPQREYVFFYPYVCTPCFLLNLDRATAPVNLKTQAGADYRWQGGVGSGGKIVAFAAICAHKLTHPSAPVSFIGYRRHEVGFLDKSSNKVERRSAVIQCCSEHSIYDPAQGAKVLSGPAPQPLASIGLDERDGSLHAVGVYGGLLYERFFERFGFRLRLEFGERAMTPVTETSTVMPIEDYTRQRIQC